MFNCYTHGWSSLQSMCPVCQGEPWTYSTGETSTSLPTKPKPKIENSWEHISLVNDPEQTFMSINRLQDKLNEIIDAINELAGSSTPTRHCEHSGAEIE